MQTLPPASDPHAQTGSLLLTASTAYLNLMHNKCICCIQLWGQDSLIRIPSLYTDNEYQIKFMVCTTLKKLSEYFNDMGILAMFFCDSRSMKKMGVCYVNLRKFIINELLSEFEDQFQIMDAEAVNRNVSTRRVIGNLVLKVTYDVPKYIVQSVIEPQKDVKCESVQRQQSMTNIHGNNLQKQSKNTKISANEKSEVLNPHSERSINHNQALQLNTNEKQPQLKIMLDAISPINRKRKLPTYQPEQGIIDRLKQKYGRNNPNLQRMRMKLEEIQVLDSMQIAHKKSADLWNTTHHALIISNLKYLQTSKTSQTEQLQITHLQETIEAGSTNTIGKKNTQQERLLLKLCIKDITEIINNPIYIGRVSKGNIVQFETQNLKGRYQIRNSVMDGQPLRISLRNKQTNHKHIQFTVEFVAAKNETNEDQIVLRNNELLVQQTNYRQQKSTSKQVNKKVAQITHKTYYYYIKLPSNRIPFNITLSNDSSDKYTTIIDQKYIFSSCNSEQTVSIVPQNQQTGIEKIVINLNKDIKYRESIINKVRVRVAVDDSLQNLMKMTNEDMSHMHHKQNTQPNQQTHQREYRISRKEQINYMVSSFNCLLCCFNAQCSQIIKKLLQQSSQSIQLFKQLCAKSLCEQPEKICQFGYQQLLHGEFSLYWQCFQQYRAWNNRFTNSVLLWRQKLYEQLAYNDMLQCQNEGNRSVFTPFQIQQQIWADILQPICCRLSSNQQLLFGLLDVKTVKTVFVRCLEIDSRLSAPRKEDIDSIIDNLLLLLSRYDAQVKVAEFVTMLGLELKDKFFICHEQLLAIYSYKEQCEKQQGQQSQITEKQLLGEVILSGNNIEENCEGNKRLYELLIASGNHSQLQMSRGNIYQNVSQRLQTENQRLRMETDISRPRRQKPDNNRAIVTENSMIDLNDRDGRVVNNHTEADEGQQIERYDRSNQTVTDNRKVQIQPRQRITICLRGIKFYPDHQNPNRRTIKIHKQTVSYDITQFPFAVCLYYDEQYTLTVSISGHACYRGLFIATSSLNTIELFDIGNGKAAACIDIQNRNVDDDEDVVLEIHDKQQLKQQTIFEPCINNQTILLQQPQLHYLSCANIRYELLSVISSSSMTASEPLQLIVDNGSTAINYPDGNLVGYMNLKQSLLQQRYVNMHLTLVNRNRMYNAKLQLLDGVQQLCINDHNNEDSVVCVLKIRLEECSQKQTNVQEFKRVVMLNIYHMQSIQLLFNDSDSVDSRQFSILINRVSQQSIMYNRIIAHSHNNLRTLPINISHKISEPACHKSQSYQICIEQHKKIVATFGMQIRYNNGLGVFHHKMYLVDREGCRLAVGAVQVNYADVFSLDLVGSHKFEDMLLVFRAENIVKVSAEIRQIVNEQNKGVEQQVQHDPTHILQNRIRVNFGFSHTQIHILFELQNQGHQLVTFFMDWDVDCVLSTANLAKLTVHKHSAALQSQPQKSATPQINLLSYSLKDLYEEYQLFDFENNGLIPTNKAEIVHRVVFKDKCPIPLQLLTEFSTCNSIDDENKQEGYIDYLFILYNLRRWAQYDDFYYSRAGAGEQGLSVHSRNSDTLVGGLKGMDGKGIDGKDKDGSKRVLVRLLAYRNLSVHGRAANLIFFVNGHKMGEPIMRCYSHSYRQDQVTPQTLTHYPITLQVKNKVYNRTSDSIFQEQLVARAAVETASVQILGGQVIFQIGVEPQRKAIQTKWQVNHPQQLLKNPIVNRHTHLKQIETETAARLRKSRRQKWEHLKNTRLGTQKIVSVISQNTQS